MTINVSSSICYSNYAYLNSLLVICQVSQRAIIHRTVLSVSLLKAEVSKLQTVILSKIHRTRA